MGAVSKGPGAGGVDSYPNTLSPQSFGPGKQNDLKKETKASPWPGCGQKPALLSLGPLDSGSMLVKGAVEGQGGAGLVPLTWWN